jgi:hypothetical protein
MLIGICQFFNLKNLNYNGNQKKPTKSPTTIKVVYNLRTDKNLVERRYNSSFIDKGLID